MKIPKFYLKFLIFGGKIFSIFESAHFCNENCANPDHILRTVAPDLGLHLYVKVSLAEMLSI